MTLWEVVAMSVVHNITATSLAEYDIDERLHVTCCHLRVRDMTAKATATQLPTSPTVCAEAVYCCCVGVGILPVIGRWPVGKMSSYFLSRLSVAVCAWLTKATSLQNELFLD